MNLRLISSLFFLTTIAIAQPGSGPSIDAWIGFTGAAGFTSTADGTQMAWTVNDRGLRNIFIQRNGKTAQLTSYGADDGQEISGLTFSPDGQHLWYVRGGAPNTSGEAPNPASLATGAERAVWRIATGGGTPERIMSGGSFTFAASGNKLLFTRGGQIHEADAAPGATSSALFTARGSNGSFSESPDGHEVLFSSSRGDHSFIGIYNKVQKQVRWIAPSVFHDVNPVWSPDGRQVAFLRTPGTRDEQLSNLTAGVTFSIMVADAATGTAAAIWTSPAGTGGHAQSYPSPVFAWHPSGRILFFSEHTGWTHVWSVKPDGSDVRDLTPGEGEVESYVATPDGKAIVFDTNIGDIDRRHLWKSDLGTGKSVQLTFGDGIEMYPSFSGKDLYCYRSTVGTNKVLVKPDASGKAFTALTGNAPVFQPARFLVPEQVIFKAADGTAVHGQLFIDRKVKGKRPGLLFMHGGPTRQMLLGFHYSDYYSYGYAFNQYLASQGYAVLSVNYRNGIGYGRKFRNAQDQGPRGAVEYQDIVAAGKFMQGLAEVDADQIGLWGGSYGGYLTAMGLARDPQLFKAGVDLHGVHDWAFRARTFWFPGGWWGITDKEMDLAYKSSPVSDLTKWTAPVLLVSGDDDRNVQFQETTDLAMRLMERNVPVEILVLPDEVHGFLRYDSWRKIFVSAADFFKRRLPVSKGK